MTSGNQPTLWQRYQTWRTNETGQEEERREIRSRFQPLMDQTLSAGEVVDVDTFGIEVPTGGDEYLQGYLGKKGLLGVAGMVVLGTRTPLAYLALTRQRLILLRQTAGAKDVFKSQAQRPLPEFGWAVPRSVLTLEHFKKYRAGTEAKLRIRRADEGTLWRFQIVNPWIESAERLATKLRSGG
ncbi:hypothetical protein [Blastococcus deserti]|uniref:PH (Pleckstrin Homology) domain-containing protein n=1 Tax=Blastococcus deserti TaxID=2259033 RepID=A0ABW4XFE1_9ACTN